MGSSRLNLNQIDASLRSIQREFDRINQTLSVPRDPMTDQVRENMMAGYRSVDEALAEGRDLFDYGNSSHLLELNTLVLCGADEAGREGFSQHIDLAKKRFYENGTGGIGDLMDWLRHRKGEDIWRRAAGTYIHILSQPQLYVEGNHRTGALIMSYVLAREGRPPFVLSAENARAYFEPSSLVKETKKRSFSMLIRMPKLTKRFAKLLKEKGNKEFLA